MANQTHKTIIFEEFDSSRDNLFTIISNDPSSDKLAIEIEKNLLVKSFDEFMQKFAPKIYEVAWRDQKTGSIQFSYTTDPTKFPNCPYVTFDIGEHAFYKMLSQLYSTRGSTGQANAKFDAKEIFDMLTPKKELEDVRDLRQKIEYNLKLFYEAEANGDISEMNTASDKVMDCREKINKYSSSPMNKLLPILIEDINRKLEFLGEGSGGNANDDAPKALPSYGVLYLNEAGQIDVLDNKKRETALKALPAAESKGGSLIVASDNHPAQITTLPAKPARTQAESPIPNKQDLQNQIAETIINDYEENAEFQSEQVKSLIVSTFAPLAASQKDSEIELDANLLLAQRTMYENAYAGARQAFANEMSRIVESLLGVKTFFDHATADGGDFAEIPEGVIISNCKASRLLKIKEKFGWYMREYFGKAQTESRIWFAVVPNVLESPPTKNNPNSNAKLNPLGGRLNRAKNSAQIDEDYVSVNALKEFIAVMDDAKIMTVFNIRVKKGNTFADLSTSEVEEKIKTFEQSNYAHAAYAYPNFTLIRERGIKPFEGKNSVEIKLPGIFIDAAYPAVGLLIASQQAKVLDSRKLKYDKDSPCVSIDFEDLQVKKKLPTKFNRESILRRSEDLIKVINENMFGFAFSGDEVKDEDGVWKNSYVHCARTLAKNKKTGVYKPIYQTLTEDYIAKELKLLPSKKETEVKKLIEKINRNCANKNGQNRYEGCVNLLLRKDEEIQLKEDGDKIKVVVHFTGGDSYVEFDVESD